jgi:hypothetical protein
MDHAEPATTAVRAIDRYRTLDGLAERGRSPRERLPKFLVPASPPAL